MSASRPKVFGQATLAKVAWCRWTDESYNTTVRNGSTFLCHANYSRVRVDAA